MIKEINKYEVLEAGSRDSIVSLTNKWINKGWEPFGGVSVCSYTTGSVDRGLKVWFQYNQAIIKKAQ